MVRKSSGWPDDVEPISIEHFEKLGINSKNELFWDGHRLITRSKLYLTFPQTILAILAVIASLATIATGLNNASLFLCGRGVAWLGCPATLVPSPAGPLPATAAPLR
jgi:hypothetical protein